MTKEESSQTKRRLSILKKSNNGKQEKRRRVSFGTSNQLITYSNNDKKINETSSLSFKREYVPLNDELTEKENFENENFEQSVSTSISKETEIDDKSLKSTPTSFLNRFFANYEDNISEDDNSTLEITGTSKN
ncbi:hypothetical protein MHBO_003853 [Bonamia ostreae]|uniref:Uncharacterized protein n=1 Tax=Bonamia ostreae TaxID=126728 RepID=A0ABV2ARP2_9EUKA